MFHNSLFQQHLFGSILCQDWVVSIDTLDFNLIPNLIAWIYLCTQTSASAEKANDIAEHVGEKSRRFAAVVSRTDTSEEWDSGVVAIIALGKWNSWPGASGIAGQDDQLGWREQYRLTPSIATMDTNCYSQRSFANNFRRLFCTFAWLQQTGMYSSHGSYFSYTNNLRTHYCRSGWALAPAQPLGQWSQ